MARPRLFRFFNEVGNYRARLAGSTVTDEGIKPVCRKCHEQCSKLVYCLTQYGFDDNLEWEVYRCPVCGGLVYWVLQRDGKKFYLKHVGKTKDIKKTPPTLIGG